MNYKSTRNSNVSVTSAEAIAEGISPDGGLYLPEIIPSFTEEELDRLADEDYIGRAKTVLSKFLTDYTEDEIDTCVRNAYKGTFDNDEPAPLARLNDKERLVIQLRYYHSLTQQRVAGLIGVSQVQVSRIEKKALERLRTFF